MKILYLTLGKKWFDMIQSGMKKEEYREVKPYWDKRLINRDSVDLTSFKRFDVIRFSNGYSRNCQQMDVEFKGIFLGTPKPEWSDNATGIHYIIRLGRILITKNKTQ